MFTKQRVDNRYLLQGEVGHGPFTRVYRALDTKHDGREVAIKFLSDLEGPFQVKQFLSEIHITSQLHHPHILQLLDSGQHEDVPYYVTHYVAGQTIRERLKESAAPISIDEAMRILVEIAEALDYAHSRPTPIVHLDIKPGNVLLEGTEAYLADFGIAKALTDAKARPPDGSPVEGSSYAFGTPAYMSPEQHFGELVDARSDVFSFGVLAYELLSGRLPYEGPAPLDFAYQKDQARSELLTLVRADIPSELALIVAKCLKRKPDDRYGSGVDLLRAIRRFSVRLGPRMRLVAKPFKLTEETCKRFSDELASKLVDKDLYFLDNQVKTSNVLVCYLHAAGLDHEQFESLLLQASHRGVAPTLFGFEPKAKMRLPLRVVDHATICRAFLREMQALHKPAITILVGCAAGADFGFHMLGGPEADAPPVDAFLALAPNLKEETCFVTRIFARMEQSEPPGIPDDLLNLGGTSATLDEWLDVHEYLVTALRRCQGIVTALQPFSRDLCEPFQQPAQRVFEEWYKGASQRVKVVRCIFAEEESVRKEVWRLRTGGTELLGPRYKAGSIRTEPGRKHFALFDPTYVLDQVDDLLRELTH